jgi:hypothetical protein
MRGLSPNMTSRQHAELVDGGKGIELSVWRLFFMEGFGDVKSYLTNNYLQVMELMLKFGADPHISISSPGFEINGDIEHVDERKCRIWFSFLPSNETFEKEVKLYKPDEDHMKWKSHFSSLLRKKGGKISLRDWFEGYERREDIKSILALIDRSIKLLEQSPTALDEIPLLLAKEAESQPQSDTAEPSRTISSKENTPVSEQSKDGANKAKGVIISQLEKCIGERMAHILLDKILGNPFAPFLLGKNAVPHVLVL